MQSGVGYVAFSARVCDPSLLSLLLLIGAPAICGLGFQVEGFGFRDSGFGCLVSGSGSRATGFGY